MTNHADLRTEVRTSLDHAIANDYPLDDWEPQQLAEDLHEYNADLEDVPVVELLPHVTEWWLERGNAIGG